MSDKFHNVQAVQADETWLYLTVDGKSWRIRWEKCSPILARARTAQRKHMIVSPSGYGIHWPEVDEDLAITPLLQSAERWSPETV